MFEDILNKIIQDGALIRTQIGMSGWESSIIISHNEDIVQINLVQEYYKMAVMTGDPIKCKYYFNEKEYLFEGQVDKVIIYDVPSMFIKITNVEIFRNKRKNVRVDVRLGANIWVKGNENFAYCVIDNLSANGLGLISRVELGMGKELKIDIFLDYHNILTVKGRIVREKRVNEYYEVGFEIDKNDKEGSENLNKTIEINKRFNGNLVKETLEQKNKNTYVEEQKKTVMIVDEDDSARFLIRKLLSLQGFSKVLEVIDGIQTINFVQKLKPEIIILDILLPTLNGNEIIEKIHSISPESKVIVVSTISNRKIIDEARSKGAVEYLVKPFDNKQLIEVIKEIS